MEKNMNFRYYFVRSQRLCGFLLLQGFILLGMEPDRKYQRRNVFRFSNSPQLLETIEKYRKLPK